MYIVEGMPNLNSRSSSAGKSAADAIHVRTIRCMTRVR